MIVPTITPNSLLAAVDLGSNSFRLEVGRFDGSQIQRVDYVKETVRQGGALDEDRNLTPEAIERGVKCLARFGEIIKGFPKQHVRAVATQTLREARNRDEFLKLGKKALGYEIEVISGVEEARLIYQGVSRLLPQSDERRLVIDIGGRSTEFILGQQFQANTMDSLRVGSVTWSMKYFPNGELSEKHFNRAEIAAESFLDAVADIYHREHWDIAYGASGTVGAIAEILEYAGKPANMITRDGLRWLRSEMIKARHVDKLKMEGLRDDRKSVIGGGLATLFAVFDLLDIDTMHIADGALRHGVLFDLIAHDSSQADNLREAAVLRLAQRFSADESQAKNVERTALQFFDAIVDRLLYAENLIDDARHLLGWAARLHEIGASISHTESHRHGAYILDNADIMGFAQSELHRLSLLVLGHYGKLRKLEADFGDTLFVAQLICLRLAVIFCHSRRKPNLRDIQFSFSAHLIQLNVSEEWREKYPQTAYLLEEEVIAWQKTDWKLVVSVI